MERKVSELKRGLRLNLRKPPKTEVPKNIYTRKEKHKKGRGDENRDLFLCHAIPDIRPVPFDVRIIALRGAGVPGSTLSLK